MSHLLASMKDEQGHVTIDEYYDGIELGPEITTVLKNVPDNEDKIRKGLGIYKADDVGNGYQESLQYPSLNVRHIETSWKGPGVKTVIPELITAHVDVRLVAETDGAQQLQKIRKHIEKQGYLLLDREPTDAERLQHSKIVKFEGHPGINAFRTDMNTSIGQRLISNLTSYYGERPVTIRTMGGTVPIVPAINTLKIPAVIVPMVNIDNNQHNPNENLRIGNIIQGIKMSMVILTMKLD
jgi:acetylornithine deacetylase/succinyl-diaminopimelate desuccinylase-like protein